ncbi:hypothetical protein [Natrinema sp. 1APR25-10V2]|uniref:hypothetical protein n=1 Tax=Natrinema sp. 1APR25-10V2 TaxID=2951081 RepID=UPI0028742556|nr:hypothetical protein [Natrinema sp. 1APR25-10V2]MDS0476927.1 hypothetical protein [Natrinema sp. 1APR25-10V2]
MAGTLRDLPAIARISYDCAEGAAIATCWFSNGAKLRYRETGDGRLLEETFHPRDPQTVWEAVEISHGEARPGQTACECLVEALAEYDWYVRTTAETKLQHDWPHLAEVLITGSDSDFCHSPSGRSQILD